MNKGKDTTGDLFQAAGEQAPFSMITEDAEMAKQGIVKEEKDKNQVDMFAKYTGYVGMNKKYVDGIVYPDGTKGELGFNAIID